MADQAGFTLTFIGVCGAELLVLMSTCNRYSEDRSALLVAMVSPLFPADAS